MDNALPIAKNIIAGNKNVKNYSKLTNIELKFLPM